MSGKRITLGTGTVAALLSIAIAAPGGAAASPAHAAATTLPDWRVALQLRSEGLNHRYGLGQAKLLSSSIAGPIGWREGLAKRSDALNRLYGLGKYAN